MSGVVEGRMGVSGDEDGSARRKEEVVPRLLRGESLDALGARPARRPARSGSGGRSCTRTPVVRACAIHRL